MPHVCCAYGWSSFAVLRGFAQTPAVEVLEVDYRPGDKHILLNACSLCCCCCTVVPTVLQYRTTAASPFISTTPLLLSLPRSSPRAGVVLGARVLLFFIFQGLCRLARATQPTAPGGAVTTSSSSTQNSSRSSGSSRRSSNAVGAKYRTPKTQDSRWSVDAVVRGCCARRQNQGCLPLSDRQSGLYDAIQQKRKKKKRRRRHKQQGVPFQQNCNEPSSFPCTLGYTFLKNVCIFPGK